MTNKNPLEPTNTSDQPKNLIILDYEGTIGDIFIPRDLETGKICISKDSAFEPHMRFRPGAVEGLTSLSKDYNVVVASSATLEFLSHGLKYLKDQGVQFDNIYDRSQVMPDLGDMNLNWLLKDLSTIFHDFSIPDEEIEKRVIFINDLQWEHSEIDKIEGGKFIIQRGCYGNPLPYNEKVPLTLLVPNPRRQVGRKAVRMDVIVNTINQLFELGNGDFLEGYRLFDKQGFKKVETDLFTQATPGEFLHRYLIIQGSHFPTEEYKRIPIK